MRALMDHRSEEGKSILKDEVREDGGKKTWEENLNIIKRLCF